MENEDPAILANAKVQKDLERKIEDCLQKGATAKRVQMIDGSLFRWLMASSPAADARRSGRLDAEFGRQSFETFLERQAIPELKKLILALAPTPGDLSAAEQKIVGGRSDLVELCELFITIGKALASLQRVQVYETTRKDIVKMLFTRVSLYARTAGKQSGSEDHPDLPAIVRDLGRLRILQWLIEMLDGQKELKSAASQARVFARLALRHAVRVIDDFLERPDLSTRFAATSITVEVDDVIVLVTDVLDGDQEAEAEEVDNFFFEKMGAKVVKDFVDRAGQLSGTLLGECEDEVIRNPTVQTGLKQCLAQIESLYLFCSRLTHEAAPKTLEAMADEIRRGVLHLVGRVATEIKPELKATRRNRSKVFGLILDLELLQDFTQRMGMKAEAAKIRKIVAQRLDMTKAE